MIPVVPRTPVAAPRASVAASLLFCALGAALALPACDAGGPEPADPPRELTTQEQAVSDAASRDFGLRLFRTVNAAEEGENVFLSPLSVSMALGMTLNGAEGATRTAMEETLALNGLSQKEINGSYQSLIELLAGLDPKVQFSLANSIWYRDTFSVRSAFIDTNKMYFDAEVAGLDFSSPQAAETINGWVEEKTQGKIPKIVPARIPPEMVMYLINAIYFKGDWTYQFDEKKTEEAPFTLADGSEKTVDMMHQTEPTFAHYGDETLEAVDLPYGDSLYTMTVLVPRRTPEGPASADSLAADLDAERWQAVTRGLRESERKAGVVLPRFELEYEKTLNDVLKAMGMEEAFLPEQSDFSGINASAGEDLYISKVKHKSFVKVNEEGTEAAAATSVGIGLTSTGPPVVRADRPFLFVIRENHSGTILFIGKVGDPPA
jgi:serpin B